MKVKYSGSVDVPVNPYNEIDDACSGPDADLCDRMKITVDPNVGGGTYGLKVTAVPGSPATDIDIYLYDAKGKMLIASENLPGTKESFTLKTPVKGTYELRISGYAAVVPSYTGTVELVKVAK
jgi:hypothetical protein